nr:WD repeat-containing protein on Y chromosome [Leptinotarsa decemlineata]
MTEEVPSVGFVKRVQRKTKDSRLELHKLLDEGDVIKIKEAFDQEDGRRMNKELLKEVLARIARIEYDDEKFNIIFMRMNGQCNGMVTWDEFISYLILGYEQQEVSLEFKTLDAPIPLPPTMLKSNHRHTINRITFYPTVKPDRSITWHDGSIMTCSPDGTINYWSLDMQIERTVQSTCPLLKIQSTWVTDMVVLPDVSVICTSSTERDLRFYDTSARKFELRVMITSFPDSITTMYYTFDKDITVPSKLIMGDMGGNLRVIFIEPEARGPFRSQPGIPLRHVRYIRLCNGGVPHMKIVEYLNIHKDFVRQVSYYPTLHALVSCSQCPKGLQMTDMTDPKKVYVYKIVAGVWCFALQEGCHIVATGSPDCLVRIWNPFMPARPICTFYGHHTGIVRMVFQDNAEKLYTLSKDKNIKVWDIGKQCLLQTYLELPPQLGERSDLTTLYNPESRQWIIGSVMIAVLPLSPKQSFEHTDGNTHTSAVSVVLYNKLFKCIVTCGLDSYIIVWDPWKGRRLVVIKEAHTVMLHGEIMPVEITAATFDPGYQRLLTGAHDGTLKIWNFNTGTCLRNMKIEQWSEVQSVIWVKNRIMAIGWNRRVTEFADTGEAVGPGGAFSKNWDLRHTEDISSATVKVPETLATSSYSGELILWRLETGQPYKKFNVSNPTARIKIQYQLRTKDKPKEEVILRRRASTTQKSTLIASHISVDSMLSGPGKHSFGGKLRDRRVSTVPMPDECFHLRRPAVHCMIFLNKRKSDPGVGTLLVAFENGVIQVWNHHVAGGFITSFSAIHKAGDYVISMATDENNEFLFIGTSVGYIKTWLLKSYCVLPQDEEHICMPKYRLMFPFTWGDTFIGRARRMVVNQPKPKLLNSYKGHFMPVSGLTYIDECQILISCSADFSARMWTLGGRYLQTIGTFKPWREIPNNQPVGPDFDFPIPADIKKVASSTTLRVLCGGTFPKRLTIKQLQKQAEKDLIHIDQSKIYGKPLQTPVLGNHYAIPERTTKPKEIEFDTSCPYIPVYQHLIMPNPVELEEETPDHIYY